ncbi:MAG: hypothetical protein H6Q69_4986, partial [Firmicutes bacterium]|nr:hypothetical protein [Bacillota bacterium]
MDNILDRITQKEDILKRGDLRITVQESNENGSLLVRNIHAENELLRLAKLGQQSQHRERVLEEKIHLLKHGFGIYDKEFPEDYVQFFQNQKINIANLIKENDQYKDRERVLREALEEVVNPIHKIHWGLVDPGDPNCHCTVCRKIR